MAERCYHEKVDAVVDERFAMEGRKKNRKMGRKHLLKEREKRTVQVGKVFEDGWMTRQIAVLSERADV